MVKKGDVEEAYRLRENTKYFLMDEYHRKNNEGKRDATAAETSTARDTDSGNSRRNKCSIVQDDDVIVDCEIAPGNVPAKGLSREDVERAREVVLAQIQGWYT